MSVNRAVSGSYSIVVTNFNLSFEAVLSSHKLEFQFKDLNHASFNIVG